MEEIITLVLTNLINNSNYNFYNFLTLAKHNL